MEEKKELIYNYIQFINYDLLGEIDSIIQEYDVKEKKGKKDIMTILETRRNEFINPHIRDISIILQKSKITKKDLELIISLIKKIINVIDDKKSFIYNSTINNKKITSTEKIDEINELVKEFLNESNIILSTLIKKPTKKTTKSTKKPKKNDDEENDKIKKEYMKYLKELDKFISFIEKNKDKTLDYIENEEISKAKLEKTKKKIKKEKVRILKVINKYNSKMEKIINKPLPAKKILNSISKNLLKIKELLEDYPILCFFKYIENEDIKHTNSSYIKVNKELFDKKKEVFKNLYSLMDNIKK